MKLKVKNFNCSHNVFILQFTDNPTHEEQPIYSYTKYTELAVKLQESGVVFLHLFQNSIISLPEMHSTNEKASNIKQTSVRLSH